MRVISVILVLCVRFDIIWGDFNLKLLHTNDVHAHVQQYDVAGSRCHAIDADNNRCYGGVARRQTVVEAIRRNYSNVLLLDAGDEFQGSVWFKYYKGREASHFMKRLGYDAMTLGNHEFDGGVADLVTPFLRDVTFPVLCCNVDMRREREMAALVQPYTVVEMEDRKIGIIGYITQETRYLANPEGVRRLTFHEPIPCIQAVVNKLQAKGVDIIIALGHSGFAYSQRVAREVKGVDIVIDGHTNTFLYNGPEPSLEKAKGPYPVVVQQKEGGRALVYQAYAYGKYLGNADLIFDDNGDVKGWKGNPILLDGSWKQDADVLAEVNKWSVPLQELSNTVIGQTNVNLQGGHICEIQECNTGDMIADAMLRAAKSPPNTPTWSNTGIAIINGGAIRAPINTGPITMGDLMATIPIDNDLKLVKITGAILRLTLEHSVTSQMSTQGHFLQMAGMRVVYDMCAPEGSRVVDVMVACSNCDEPRLVPVNDDVIYNVITTNYISSGGDGYLVLRDNIIQTAPHGPALDDSVIEYIRSVSPISQEVEDRTHFTNSPPDCHHNL